MSAIPSRFEYQVAGSHGASKPVNHLKIVMFESSTIETPQRASGLPQPAPGFQRLANTPELLEELADASSRLEKASPEEIISWGVEHYAPYLTMATAFGPEGCVILAMLAKIAPETYVFNLDTGYQFQETIELRDRIAEKYAIEVDLLTPDLSVPEYEALHGGPLYKTNPNQCCADRKIKTLQRASEVMHAWMSGIRRDQSADRVQAKIVGWDKKFGLVKISPLANWTKKEVWLGKTPPVGKGAKKGFSGAYRKRTSPSHPPRWQRLRGSRGWPGRAGR